MFIAHVPADALQENFLSPSFIVSSLILYVKSATLTYRHSCRTWPRNTALNTSSSRTNGRTGCERRPRNNASSGRTSVLCVPCNGQY